MGEPTQEKKRDVGEAVEEGPGVAFQDFEAMASIVNKLKLLNYDELFCQRLKFKPFSQHYFAIKTNPGEQFWNFSSLSSWLIRECGKNFDQPQEVAHFFTFIFLFIYFCFFV